MVTAVKCIFFSFKIYFENLHLKFYNNNFIKTLELIDDSTSYSLFYIKYKGIKLFFVINTNKVIG